MKKFTKRTGLLTVNSGFTLIELLIVIVIIGILAGVLIAVIDPTTQQNRARDATLRATMNKLALSINGYIAAYGRIPNDVEVGGGINNFSAVGTQQSDEADLMFDLGNPISSTCNANSWDSPGDGSGSSACHFFYCGGDAVDCTTACTWSSSPATTQYRLCAKAWGSENVFMYRSSDSAMYLCDNAGENCVAQ